MYDNFTLLHAWAQNGTAKSQQAKAVTKRGMKFKRLLLEGSGDHIR